MKTAQTFERDSCIWKLKKNWCCNARRATMATEMKFVFRMGNELNWLRSKIPLKMTVKQPSIEQLDRNVTCTRASIHRLKAKPYVSFVSINRHLIRLICYTMHMRFKCFSVHRLEYQSQFFREKKVSTISMLVGRISFP